MEPLRVGIIGCGEVTQLIHLPTLAFLPDLFRVDALCDVSPGVLEAVADRWRVAGRHTDPRALIEDPEIDAVVVANPDAFHVEAVLAALAAGKDVLVEKPMAMTLRETDDVINAAREAGRVVQVGYMRRYAPAFLQACRLVPEIGPIRLARVHDVIGSNHLVIRQAARVVRPRDLSVALVESGRQAYATRVDEAIGPGAPETLRTAYGILLGLSSHDISAMRELLGMPKRVLYAAARNGGMCLSAAFDYGEFVCNFETGIDGIPRFDGHIEVYGDEKVVRVEYDTPYLRNLPIRLRVTAANGDGGVEEHASQPDWGDPFVAEWRAFHDNVRERRTPKTSPADYRHDLELFAEMIELMRS
jgi:predicted dehydrogenase